MFPTARLALGLVTLALLSTPCLSAEEPRFVVRLDERQLFLDDEGIHEQNQLARTLHRPKKKGAVIRPDLTLGETSLQIRSGPAWNPEDQKFKLWLISPTCYESRDGLHWTRTEKQPNLTVINATIDPDDSDPNRRYKGLVSVPGGRQIVVSPDGLQWEKLDAPHLPSQDESNLSYDRVERKFIATVKQRGPFGRTVWLSTSRDFLSWSRPELIFHPDKQDQELGRRNIEARLAKASLQPLQYVDPTVYGVQVYNMGVFRYEGHYVGLPAMFHTTGPVPDYPNTDGFHLIELVSSRDLRNWRRLGERRPFIGPSPRGSGAYDLTQILPPSHPVVRGDELWFYYTGLKYRSAGSIWKGKYPDGKWLRRPGADRDSGAICLAVLRRDGFLSLEAGGKPGTMVTETFRSPGGTLHLNVDAAEGMLRVEALDASGEVKATSTDLTGDEPRLEVKWKEGTWSNFTNSNVRLRFTLRNARLYSYWLKS